MTSAKRIHEYSQLIRENGDEKHRNKTFIQPPQDWPSRGIIEFKNYTFRYQPELDPVLKNLNLRNDSNEKIGIIGRTGAEKSSILQALFRLVDQTAITGAILMDDIDIITESYSNLSVGEHQLICVARAILKKSHILSIDKATANVDHTTDQIIQEVIEEKFRDRTILTIAHRLNTIANSNRILMLEKGEVAYFGPTNNINELADSSSSSSVVGLSANAPRGIKVDANIIIIIIVN